MVSRHRSAEPAPAVGHAAVLLGSGSASGDAARAVESLPVLAPPLATDGHGRSPAGPTPPLMSSGPLRCTPSPVRLPRAAVAAGGAVGLQCLAPLFEERQDAILPSPTPTPVMVPVARRKTMAGINISKTGGGFSISKPRAAGRPKAPPAARAAEMLVCHTLGIVKGWGRRH